ncbi:MAG: TIGR03621 family F420-dependent LLM class oxidoreductase [Desertimonas sp.]
MSSTSPRPFRFGVQVQATPDAATWTELARRVEGSGYDVLTMPDHFTEQFAPVPALMTAAAVTERLRIGALVFDNDYKHPLVLAKELATMDVLSDGRVEIGLGAGWMRSDYDESGIAYDRAGVRIDRFVEGLAVIKGCLSEGPFSFNGEHYTITDYDGKPLPVQRPRPPILIGGGGPRVLGIAAREAEIVGINGTMAAGVIGPEAISTMTLEAVEEKLAIVGAAAGGRADDIELNIRVFFVKVTDDRAGTIDAVARTIEVDPTMIERSPFALIGSVDQIVEDIVRRREQLGFSYLIVGAENVDEFAPVVARLAGT